MTGTGLNTPEDLIWLVPGLGPTAVNDHNHLALEYLRSLPLNGRQHFWSGPIEPGRFWPRDAFGKVFLARALHTVGAALHSTWTGYEPSAPDGVCRLHQSSYLHDREDALAAVDALEAWRPGEPYLTVSAVFDRSIDHESWLRAIELRNQVCDLIEEAKLRWFSACSRLAEAMRDDEIQYFLRHDDTGDFSPPLQAKWWNTEGEEWAARFTFCLMSEVVPISKNPTPSNGKRLFVDAEGLRELVASLKPEPFQKRGNKKIDDSLAVAEMLGLLESGKAASAWEAARLAAPNAKGAGTPGSRQRRIHEAFKDAHPTLVGARHRE